MAITTTELTVKSLFPAGQGSEGSKAGSGHQDRRPPPTYGDWPGFRIGLLKVATGEKKVDSRAGMQRTVESAPLYQSWPQQAAQDLATIKRAIADRDLELLGQTAEQNALSMHATMIA